MCLLYLHHQQQMPWAQGEVYSWRLEGVQQMFGWGAEGTPSSMCPLVYGINQKGLYIQSHSLLHALLCKNQHSINDAGSLPQHYLQMAAAWLAQHQN